MKKEVFTTTQQEAIEVADSHINSVLLPGYSTLFEALEKIANTNGSTGGMKHLIREFQITARIALASNRL